MPGAFLLRSSSRWQISCIASLKETLIFLVELVRYARRNNLLTSDGALNLSAISAEPIAPQTVYSMIQTLLHSLSEGARRVLDAAVAQGREFEFEIVAQVAGLSEMAALDAIDELREKGLISLTEGNVLRFDHTLTMEVAYREVGELRHRLLHRRVAEALESQYRDHLDQVAGQLAWHFAEGGALQRAARYALKAGAQAANLAAWSEAGKFYELALQGLGEAERLPALQGLAKAYSKAGNYARACDVLCEAITLAKTQQRILALNNLAYHLHLFNDPATKEYACAGLELAQEKGVLGLQAYLYCRTSKPASS